MMKPVAEFRPVNPKNPAESADCNACDQPAAFILSVGRQEVANGPNGRAFGGYSTCIRFCREHAFDVSMQIDREL